MFILWLSAHKNVVYAVLALGLWVAAQYWYFKGDIRNFRKARRAHIWEVDMKTKTVTRGRSAVR